MLNQFQKNVDLSLKKKLQKDMKIAQDLSNSDSDSDYQNLTLKKSKLQMANYCNHMTLVEKNNDADMKLVFNKKV